MFRYVLYVAATFLIVDHVYTHWGPGIINSIASGFLGRKVTVVEEAPYRESIIDRAIKEIKRKLGR